LGSVTKQFTAAAILLLEERGKLKTDDPVKKFMSDAPTAWEKITIYHLLAHTSGIPNFTSFPDYPSQKPFAATPEKLVARFRDKPLDFQPGEKWSYSNSGYILWATCWRRPAARAMRSSCGRIFSDRWA
jgi:CubicO group peptidase (beta-lactamase class C family)